MGNFKARKSRALKFPIPLGRSPETLNLTALEDEFQLATIDQAASRALVGRKIRYRPNTRR